MYAAAGAEIRKGDWRGRTVTVCAGEDCIRVTLIDWCACEGNRVIDLYGDAFRRLAPLGRGRHPGDRPLVGGPEVDPRLLTGAGDRPAEQLAGRREREARDLPVTRAPLSLDG